MKLVTVAALALSATLLGSCGHKEAEQKQEQEQEQQPTAEAQPAVENSSESPSAAAAPPAFGICATCHTTVAGTNGIGPSLYGVVGRKAGSLPGYTYSDAMKNSGITWDSQTIDRYITNPQAMVPGNKMPFAGLSEAQKRTEIIAYLATLK